MGEEKEEDRYEKKMRDDECNGERKRERERERERERAWENDVEDDGEKNGPLPEANGLGVWCCLLLLLADAAKPNRERIRRRHRSRAKDITVPKHRTGRGIISVESSPRSSLRPPPSHTQVLLFLSLSHSFSLYYTYSHLLVPSYHRRFLASSLTLSCLLSRLL